MPELPEVHTVLNTLIDSHLVGRWILESRILWERSVSGSDPDFETALTGLQITSLFRRGKLLVLVLEQGWHMIVHLRMAGMVYVAGTPEDPYIRVACRLEDGRFLCFRDVRKFGRCLFTRDPSPILNRVGPDPLAETFDYQTLQGLLASRRRVKPLLLDQTVIGGLGNIYVDEALWYARVHPLRRATSLNSRETKRLAASIRYVLLQGIRNGGTRLGGGKGNFLPPGGAREPTNQHHLRVFQQAGRPCPRCGTPIVKSVVAQRGTHTCPRCQPAPVPVPGWSSTLILPE